MSEDFTVYDIYLNPMTEEELEKVFLDRKNNKTNACDLEIFTEGFERFKTHQKMRFKMSIMFHPESLEKLKILYKRMIEMRCEILKEEILHQKEHVLYKTKIEKEHLFNYRKKELEKFEKEMEEMKETEE